VYGKLKEKKYIYKYVKYLTKQSIRKGA